MLLEENVCKQVNDVPIDKSEIPDYSNYSKYIGIREDPIGKTSEQYHIRERMTYNKDGITIYTQEKVFYRVKDLVPVYEYLLVNQDNQVDYWTEYLNGGMMEYNGTFTDLDFQIPQCKYPAIYDTNFLQ